MIKQFLIADENHPVEPDDAHPFVVLTHNRQPIGLIALHPFAVEPPPSESKTAAVLVVPRQVPSVEENYPKVLAAAHILLEEAIDAEGVILVDEGGEIYGVLPTENVLVPDESDIRDELHRHLRDRRQIEPHFEQLPGGKPNVIASVVYSCPKPSCSSPDYTLWQVGMEIPACEIHHIPREPKYKEEKK